MNTNKVGRYLRIVGILLVVVLGGWGLYYYWRTNSPWVAERELEQNYEATAAFYGRYEEAMRNDTYGGKTPEETLQLFIAALEKGDIDLASKYFALETNENDPDYLTRRKWEEGLKEAEKAGRISEILNLVKNMVKSPRNLGTSEAGEYVVYDNEGIVERALMFVFNKQSGAWKIESL